MKARSTSLRGVAWNDPGGHAREGAAGRSDISSYPATAAGPGVTPVVVVTLATVPTGGSRRRGARARGVSVGTMFSHRERRVTRWSGGRPEEANRGAELDRSPDPVLSGR
ncbi:hypothetical protein GCM10011374_30670 [Kocuria dechangensis]|uniref:Uncharacterized protein n=1 Tax=Kocuria dechangensis TaxID=1176249 RepID=A0A917H1T4_9MICC|nr:hypothetical protein GCM10011374_30670 [Kocuria dechangensis]